MTPRLLLLGLIAACPAAADDWVPRAPDGAAETASRDDGTGFHAIAIGPASAMAPPPTLPLDGTRTRIAWQAAAEGPDALALLNQMRAQLLAAEYEVIFTCSGQDCGGFDFRRTLALLPMPDMIVDLGGFHYLGARRGPDESPEALASLIASDAAGGAYLQLTLVAPDLAPPPTSRPDTQGAPEANPDPVPDTTARIPATVDRAFAETGRLTLDDVEFATGTTDIAGTPPASLRALADWLTADPARRVALVGHTDWVGAPAINIALSQRRASAVAELLTGTLGVSATQIVVEGAGPFAPRAPNHTEAGRAANRRVEAVALPSAP